MSNDHTGCVSAGFSSAYVRVVAVFANPTWAVICILLWFFYSLSPNARERFRSKSLTVYGVAHQDMAFMTDQITDDARMGWHHKRMGSARLVCDLFLQDVSLSTMALDRNKSACQKLHHQNLGSEAMCMWRFATGKILRTYCCVP